MLDRLMQRVLRGTVVALIAACVVVALTFLHAAMFALIATRWQSAASLLALAMGCAVGFVQLWRYRNDLVYY